MSSEKNYHALIPDKIFMGAATDVESMVKHEGIDVIVDLRGEATECAYHICSNKKSITKDKLPIIPQKQKIPR